MALFSSFKINKAIDLLLMSEQESVTDIQNAVTKIKSNGRSAVPYLIEVLSDEPNNKYINKLLSDLLNNKSLPEYIDALTDDNRNVVRGTMDILAASSSYDPNLLLGLFKDPDIPNNVLTHILLARRQKLDGNNFFVLMNKVDSPAQKALLYVLDEIATERMIPQLIKYSTNDDVNVRQQIVKTLSKFDSIQVRDTLIGLLADSSTIVRQFAVKGLGGLTVEVPSEPLCKALRDPDINVQKSAIEALAKTSDENLITNLVDLLQDESEYVRRAAVEVLNEVSNTGSIKELLNAMRDTDWWVKVRAADALCSIGGANVIDAIFELITDKDEFLRRSAVEILNSMKDERAFYHLVKALKDSDWWVRERAADALANLGDKRAVAALFDMMKHQTDSSSIALKALADLGDESAVQPLLNILPDSNKEIQNEIIHTLGALSTPDNNKKINDAIDKLKKSAEAASIASQNESMDTIAIDISKNSQAPSSSGNIAPPAQAPSDPNTMQIVDADALQAGDMISERYQVIKKIGKGAFGVVLLVKDNMVGEEIILKFLHPQMITDKTIIDRFVHELRFSRKLTHENVIRIYDFITFGKSYAISMEYFKSHSLSEEIKTRKSINIARTIKIIIDICKGLAVAHDAQVVHRDIKPANILVDDKDVVKIVDFGLAAATMTGDSRMTKSGILVGTPTYMAPEQVRGRAIDTRTDIYSLGVVMYELLTGIPPYKGADHMATLFKHVEGGAKPPSVNNPQISDHLDRIVMKMLHIDPTERYQTTNELRRDLVMALAKEVN